MNILGIWDGHDSGAALLIDGALVAAVNEERLTRRKLEVRFPTASIKQCLAMGGLTATQVDAVAVSTSDVAKTLARIAPWTKERYYLVRRRKIDAGPFAAFTRRAKYLLTNWPSNSLTRLASTAVLRRELARLGITAPVLLFDHHYCHAVAAAYATGEDRCAVLTIDGVGDGLSTTTSIFRQGTLTRLISSPATHSLGIFFEHVTTLLNMRELEDEGKVMALAEYASPVADPDNPLIDILGVHEGRLTSHPNGRRLIRMLRACHWRVPNEQFASMAQRVIERTCVALAHDAARRTGERHLALAGGVVSNIKATRLVRLHCGFEHVHVFPHMGDGGLALGAALASAAKAGDHPRLDLTDLGFGPEYTDERIRRAIGEAGLNPLPSEDVEDRVATLLSEGAIVMWFDGRMEYGPRALGHRSVLARPDRRAIRDRLNLVLKRRVWYQPFCPSMLRSDAGRLLEDWTDDCNPHMTMAYMVRKDARESLCGVIGIDGSCRPQVVHDEAPGRYARLLRLMRERLGSSVLLNTSYNIHGEPLVCTPEDAVDVFLRSGADALAIGSHLVMGCHG